MTPVIRFLRLFCSITIITFTLAGCAASAPRTHEKRESHPLESFPETEFEPINPLEKNSYVALSVSLAPGNKSAGENELDAIAIEDELLRLINLSRSEAELDMLQADETILWAARIRSGELISNFSHTRPDGTAYYTVFDEVGYSYSGKWHGENASIVSFPEGTLKEADIAALMFEDLSGSPGHLKNMRRSQYGLVGIGVSVSAGEGKTIVASSQLFSGK